MGSKLFLTMVLMSTIHISSGSGWTNKRMDIYFMLDSTTSMSYGNFDRMNAFVASLINDMDIGPSKTRVGVSIFANKHLEKIPINNELSKADLMNTLKYMERTFGATSLTSALSGMLEQGLAEARRDVARVGVLITDGAEYANPQAVKDAADAAKRDGIFLFTIGVGRDTNKLELQSIASDPTVNFNYMVDDVRDLPPIKNKISEKMSLVELRLGDQNACGGRSLVDTIFVYDEAAMGLEASDQVKSFIKEFIQHIDMDSGNMRVGIISKTCVSQAHDINLNEHLTKADLTRGLDEDRTSGITELLERAQLDLVDPLKGGRSLVKKRIVLLLNEPDVSQELMRKAIRSRTGESQIEIFVISLKETQNKNKVFFLSFSRSDDHVVRMSDVKDLGVENYRDVFRQKFCKDI